MIYLGMCRGLYRGIVGLLLLGALCGCSPTPEPPTDDGGRAALEGRIERVENGLLPRVAIEGEEPLLYTLVERMAHYGVPGVSIAVISDAQIDWAKGYGLADVESSRPVTPETLFQAASISKPVAAAGALRLVQEGRLTLDRPVNELLVSWQVPAALEHKGGAAAVDLRGLLSHTAGLSVHGFPGYEEGEELPTVLQILDGEPPANTEPVRVELAPGAEFRYSGGGYTVLQALMTDSSGELFPDLMRELVMTPVGMTDSTYEQPLPDRLRTRAASGYRADGAKIAGDFHAYPEMAAAGLWTTPTDLARFAIEIHTASRGASRALLDREMVRDMLKKGRGDWGLGFKMSGGKGERRFGHGGSNAGFRAMFVAYRDIGLGAVVMTNGDRGAALAREIVLGIARAYEWPGYGPEVRNVATVGLSVFVEMSGEYELAGGGRVYVTVESGGLYLEAPDIPRSRLYPYAENLYFFRERPEEVQFRWEEETPARGLTIGDRLAERVERGQVGEVEQPSTTPE